MQITLNKNSWHFKYYKWSLESETPPKSLCPYFWSMVGLILLFPFILLIKGLSYRHDKSFEKKWEKRAKMTPEQIQKANKRDDRRDRIIEYVGKGFVGIILLFGVFLIGALIYTGIGELGWLEFVKRLFMIIGILTVLVLIVITWVDKNIGGKIINSKLVQVPIAMVKAVYTKACPLIKWNDTKVEPVIAKE